MTRQRRRRITVSALLATFVFLAAEVGAVTLTGDGGSDTIFGTAAADRLDGAGGSDIIFGKSSPKPRRGTRPRPDTIMGGPGEDVLYGGKGVDVLVGGDDVAFDLLHDSDGRAGDKLRAGPGNDFVFAADGAATIVDCGSGTDTVLADAVDRLTGCEQAITGTYPFVLIASGAQFNVIYGSSAAEPINGTVDGDIVLGLGGSDQLNLAGSNEADWTDGGSGADQVFGSGELDRIVDDDGTPGDQLFGGLEGDLIFTADGAIDQIDCGNAADVDIDFVWADENDVVNDCGVNDVIVRGDGEIV